MPKNDTFFYTQLVEFVDFEVSEFYYEVLIFFVVNYPSCSMPIIVKYIQMIK